MPYAEKQITDFTSIDPMLRWADRGATKLLNDGRCVVVRIGYEDQDDDRSISQNSKAHAMIGDIAKQAVFKTPGLTVSMSGYDLEEVKALLVVWFERECIQMLDPLRHGSRVVIDPFTGEQITIRPSTTKFLKAESNNFIEWLYSIGSDGGVKWSEPALKEYESYSQAKYENYKEAQK